MDATEERYIKVELTDRIHFRYLPEVEDPNEPCLRVLLFKDEDEHHGLYFTPWGHMIRRRNAKQPRPYNVVEFSLNEMKVFAAGLWELLLDYEHANQADEYTSEVIDRLLTPDET